MINISGPTTLTLSPQTFATILDALSDVPYRKANPAIAEIMEQLNAQQVPVQPPPAPEPPAPPAPDVPPAVN